MQILDGCVPTYVFEIQNHSLARIESSATSFGEKTSSISYLSVHIYEIQAY